VKLVEPRPRRDELANQVGAAMDRLGAVHRAREVGLVSCRSAISSSGRAIRAIHRREPAVLRESLAAAEASIRAAQVALADFPAVAHAGFLHDAEKEFAEARLTAALVAGEPLASAAELAVGVPAWCNGLAEAASELRRHLLDRLREGSIEVAEELLAAMEDVYETLMYVDYPDAITGGLRRTTDSLRAVLERTRSDLTVTVVQERLRLALEVRSPGGASLLR
jgi:translin